MANKTKEPVKVPKLGALLGVITENAKHQEPSPKQMVVPVDDKKTAKRQNEKTEKEENANTVKRTNTNDDAVNTFSRENVQTEKSINGNDVKRITVKAATGRKSVKLDDVEYIKISPRIPEFLKIEAGKALLEKRFTSTEGVVIRTMDELVSHALEKLLYAK
jgi:hypothetical protein